MDAVLNSLGELLLRALPTFILLVVLHFYLKWVFYRPIDRLLKRRWEATEGARKAASEALALAGTKAAAYQEAIRKARSEIFAEHEETQRGWQRRKAAAIAEMRHGTETSIRDARAGLAAEAETARQNLQSESESLAEEIAGVLLRRRAS